MRKSISKIFLIAISISMVLLIILLSFFMNEEITMEDLCGNRNALGDMNIVYQKSRGSYETDQIIISKNKEEVKKYVKAGCRGFSVSKKNIENRDIFQYINSFSDICENNDEIASISMGSDYSFYDSNNMMVYINLKNKKTKKIKEYKIEMEEGINLDSVYKVLPVRNNDNIYLAIISSLYNENSLGNDDIYKQTYLNLYKINLSTQKSKCIISKSYEASEMNVSNENGFVRGNVCYFLVNMKNKKNGEMETCLFAFNVITKDVNVTNLKIGNKEITNYYVDDNEVLLSSEFDDESEKLQIITVNLNTYNVKKINEINVTCREDKNKNIVDMREDKNKIFIIVSESSYDGSFDADMNYYIYVINKENNKNLYKGKIKEKNIENIDFGILKKEEI